ncbi:MAG: excinuclease ABC subunit UvrA [Kiritimatiellae bacterium]|nr:excinuclease ABC subunit UvrA [Kiritimatiellia bacterium]
MEKRPPAPACIAVRGARVHNLKDLDVDIPLGEIVGIAGVSGSGKSSLALGVLYAEGSRRYLEALSTYTRRRMTQAAKADVREVLHVPAALALHQRPAVPGVRSTFGTGTELLNSLRLLFSRCGSHRCPNGHYAPPSTAVAAEREIVCPECGAKFFGPGAEDLAFNSAGACRRCDGTGVVRTVDPATIVPDDSLTIDEGAVAPWQSLMWSLMKDIARDRLGVRTDVPWRDLTDRERDVVLHGPAEKHHMVYQMKTGESGEMDFTFFNAFHTVENALRNVKDEKGMKRVAKFLKEDVCPDCGGSRLSEKARAPRLRGLSLADAAAMTLEESVAWVRGVPAALPAPMRPMARSICESFLDAARRLAELGLGYLALDRASSTLSTGERQRMQLARAVRNRTAGVLYVLDEPSIGLHPANLEGLVGVMRDLVADGNGVVLVDHDPQVLRAADWIVELGPGAGARGGTLVAQGTVDEIAANPASVIGPFLRAGKKPRAEAAEAAEVFADGEIRLRTGPIHTVRALDVRIPRGRLVAVTGVSGSGKTTLVLESLVPALQAAAAGAPLPAHVRSVSAPGVARAQLIDATPIGINVRSTVATYADVHDELRKAWARTPDAKARGLKAGDFSYNTGSLRCPTCDGTGSVSLDVQFLPDVEVPCPDCRGSRYSKEASAVLRARKSGGKGAAPLSLPALMSLSVDDALEACADLPLVAARLRTLHDLGLGYLGLGEQTPGLSGGEAQRLKLASEMGRGQADAVFVFDEPTIGLHPLDVRTLLGVFRRLVGSGATVVVIEHDLDLVRACDWVLDMGPGGGAAGGRLVAAGTPAQIAACPGSVTGRYL